MTQAVEPSQSLGDLMLHTLYITLPDQPIHVSADTARMAQVISNLLNNGYRFTPRGGRISLQLYREGSHAIIPLRDTVLA